MEKKTSPPNSLQTILLEEIRRKYPGLAKKESVSDRAAIRIFCICCMGGDTNEVKNCTATEETCPFYIRRTGKNEKRKKKTLSIEEKELARKRLQKARKKKTDVTEK